MQPATGMNADSVAEYVINAALTLLKNIPLMHQETLIGNWPRTSISSRELRGKTIGLLGFGLIAKKVSTLAKVFDAKIIAYDPYLDQSVGNQFDTKLLDINDVFRMSDIISIHLPLTENTKNLLISDNLDLTFLYKSRVKCYFSEINIFFSLYSHLPCLLKLALIQIKVSLSYQTSVLSFLFLLNLLSVDKNL